MLALFLPGALWAQTTIGISSGPAERPAVEAPQASPLPAQAELPRPELPRPVELPRPAPVELPPPVQVNNDPSAAADGDACVYPVPYDPDFADKARRFSRTLACDTLEMVDGWFGDRPFDKDTVYGKLTQKFSYDQYNGLKYRTRFRMRGELPNALNRWNIIIGRGDPEELNNESAQGDRDDLRNQLDTSRADDDWLVGIGSRQNEGSRWGYSASVRLTGGKLDPYVRARYRRLKKLDARTDFRYTQTFFWSQSRDFGTTTDADMTYTFDDELLFRGQFVGTVAGDTSGVDWWTGTTLYQWINGRNSMRYHLYLRGETGDDVAIHEYGSSIIFRHRLRKDWLYVEVGPTVFWPRRDQDEVREATYGLTVQFDLFFGDQ